MLTSIHPLGERARRNRWEVTVAAMVVGSVASGAVIGALLGFAGGALPTGPWRWAAAGIAVLAAGAADLGRIRPPGPRRQVNEDWVGAFRGWVYGGAFGAQLGAGAATFVVTWGVWATAVLALLTGHPLSGAVVGSVFGLGRTLASVAAGWIDRPSRLTSFSRTMARLTVPVSRTVAAAFIGLGIVAALVTTGAVT